MKNLNKLKLKECPKCKGGVIQHFDTCPHCGACQSKRCTDEDKRIKAIYSDNRLPINYNQEKPLNNDQGYGNM